MIFFLLLTSVGCYYYLLSALDTTVQVLHLLLHRFEVSVVRWFQMRNMSSVSYLLTLPSFPVTSLLPLKNKSTAANLTLNTLQLHIKSFKMTK